MYSEITEKDVLEGKDKEMILEKNRLKSYKVWPFSEGVCTKESVFLLIIIIIIVIIIDDNNGNQLIDVLRRFLSLQR
jgi:hypothetical protein